MKILWHSNTPWAATGYGQQTAAFLPRIRDLGYEVAVSAAWGLQGAPIEYDGMTVYPMDDKWGNRTIATIAEDFGRGEPVLVITLLDVWPLTSDAWNKLDHLASWTPVDHFPTPPRVVDFFDRTGARPIAMSEFGQRALTKNAGGRPLYVPHGIDTSVFRPRPEDRPAARRQMGVPEDAFVVGMVANNKGVAPPRKAFPQVFLAFSAFRKDHPDAYLYLHTDLTGMNDGVNLGALAEACDLPSEAIKYTPPRAYEHGIEQAALSRLYSAFDVLAHPSYGEGFGVPIVESQACGTPVIVTDWTSMTELCGSGWLVNGDYWYDATQGAFYKCPSLVGVQEAMERAYERRGDQGVRDRAREFAVQYDADTVTREFWKPVLEELTSSPAPQEPSVEVLKPRNRAERRAQRKAAA